MPTLHATVVHPDRRRSGMVILWVLVLVAVLGLMGFLGSTQVTTTRRLLERSHARTLLYLIADSAFEEACARLEQKVGVLPVPPVGGNRDLATTLPTSQSIDPQSTRTAFAGFSLKLDPVQLRSSPWMFAAVAGSGVGSGRQVQEVGIMELSVVVRMQTGGSQYDRRVTVRRYANTVGDTAAGGARLKIQAANLAMEVTEP